MVRHTEPGPAQRSVPDSFLNRRRRPPGTHAALVDAYYEAVTDFYEHGWGRSFHFAPRFAGETRRESLLRHEYYLALRHGLESGMHVLDVGCGIGGPMSNIARFANVDITGVTINGYQVALGERHNSAAGLANCCRLIEADFADIPADDGVFDAAFAIEATCHAADRTAVFKEVFRVLRHGAAFAGYDWCLTDRFNPREPQHLQLKREIEETIAIPALTGSAAISRGMIEAGFDLVESGDAAASADPETPWYRPLTRAEGGVQGALISRPGLS